MLKLPDIASCKRYCTPLLTDISVNIISGSLLSIMYKCGILNISWLFRRWNEGLGLRLSVELRIDKIWMLQEKNMLCYIVTMVLRN